MNEFDRELEQTLHRVLDPLSARPVPGRRAIRQRGVLKTLMGGAGAALGIKLLTGAAVAAAAITVAGAATTGSLDPAVWERQVQHQTGAQKSEQTGVPGSQQGHSAPSATSSAKAVDSSGGAAGSGGQSSQGGANGSGQDAQPPTSRDAGDPTDPSSSPQNPNHISPRP